MQANIEDEEMYKFIKNMSAAGIPYLVSERGEAWYAARFRGGSNKGAPV